MGTFSGGPTGRLVRGLDTPGSGGALAHPGCGRCRGRISLARSRSRLSRQSGLRCSSSSPLPSDGQMPLPLPTTSRPASTSSRTRRGAARSRSSWAARSGSRGPDCGCPRDLRAGAPRARSAKAGPPGAARGGAHQLGVVEPADPSDRRGTDRQARPRRTPWRPRQRDPLATMAHYEVRLALDRDRAIELHRRARAGNLVASGSVAFMYAVMMLPQSGLLDEAVSIFNQTMPRPAGAGTSSTSRSC